MKVSFENVRKVVALVGVPVGQCVRLYDGEGIYMRTNQSNFPQAPEWVRLNDGVQFYTRDLERCSSFVLADVEVVVHG